MHVHRCAYTTHMQNGAAALSVQACEVRRHADHAAAWRRRRECSPAPRRDPSAGAEVIVGRPHWRCTFSLTQAASAGGQGRNPSRQRIPRALRLHLATPTLTRLTSTRRKRWTRQHASNGAQVKSPTETIGGNNSSPV